ncbi:hypothetical protein STVIR_1997 [Streptomyces viridochromogenes Tue57]|uniref:Uncharacterized protein n=1 Tax=Streptomyces viridochromogenes Tue57 TaxID=1160705 RepID=L8PLU8_STRVR|nr:hypothetical protein STVIR_1997 [Streptomyces viridochromogenes Tue57]
MSGRQIGEPRRGGRLSGRGDVMRRAGAPCRADKRCRCGALAHVPRW